MGINTVVDEAAKGKGGKSVDWNKLGKEGWQQKETGDTCHFDILLTKNVPHILETIFLSLDFESFKKCHEVNSAWNELLISESFQRKVKALRCEVIREEKNLMQASIDGNVKQVRRLLSICMVDVNCEDPLGWPYRKNTPLLEAASKGHKDVVKLLLDIGADPEKADSGEWTALHWAAYNKHEDVVKLLLDRGAQPNKSSIYGSTPLHEATQRTFLEVL